MKLPVVATCGQAYAFLTWRLGFVLRMIWLPVLLSGLVNVLAGWADIEARIGAGLLLVPGPIPLSLAAVVAVYVHILAVTMVAVALHRAILFGDFRSGSLFLFSLTRIDFLVAAIPAASATVLLLLRLVGADPWAGLFNGGTRMPALLALLGLIISIAMFYVSVRLMLIAPAIVIRRQFALAEAWSLSQGRFWRFTGIGVLGFLPLAMIGAVAWIALSYLFPRIVAGLVATMTVVGALRAAVVLGTAISAVAVILGVVVASCLASYTYKAVMGLPPDARLSKPSTAMAGAA